MSAHPYLIAFDNWPRLAPPRVGDYILHEGKWLRVSIVSHETQTVELEALNPREAFEGLPQLLASARKMLKQDAWTTVTITGDDTPPPREDVAQMFADAAKSQGTERKKPAGFCDSSEPWDEFRFEPVAARNPPAIHHGPDGCAVNFHVMARQPPQESVVIEFRIDKRAVDERTIASLPARWQLPVAVLLKRLDDEGGSRPIVVVQTEGCAVPGVSLQWVHFSVALWDSGNATLHTPKHASAFGTEDAFIHRLDTHPKGERYWLSEAVRLAPKSDRGAK